MNEEYFKHPHIQLPTNFFEKPDLKDGDIVGHLGLTAIGSEVDELLELYIYTPNKQYRRQVLDDKRQRLGDMSDDLDVLFTFDRPGLSSIITNVKQIDTGIKDYPNTLSMYHFGNIKENDDLLDLITKDSFEQNIIKKLGHKRKVTI